MGDSPREMVSASQLYAMLTQAFDKARDPRCRRCVMPLPVFRAASDPESANWHTGVPRHCPFRCHLVIGEVQAMLWVRYDMRPFPTGVEPAAKTGAQDDVAQ